MIYYYLKRNKENFVWDLLRIMYFLWQMELYG